MTPHDIIYSALLREHGIHHADQLADDILERLAVHGFAAVHVSAVIQQDGKVTVSRSLLDSVLADAETWVTAHYFTDGEVHPALMDRYERDMCDIRLLRAEIGGEGNE